MPSPQYPNPEDGIIQSPQINAAGKPTQTSVKDAGMAKDIVETLITSNRNRQIVNSRIMAKYNAERPYDSYKMEAEGLGWRQNFTTKPLPMMIEKVAPRFTEAVANLKYLTNAALSNKWENSTEKTEKFRKIITETIRARKGWKTLVEDIAFDNALFGHTVVAWLDELSWFPKHFSQDASFLADGTPQDAFASQVVVLKEVLLPHELFEFIKDREAADMAGWNIQNTVKQINTASPKQLQDQLGSGGTIEAWYQNAQRELTLGTSYMTGASVIVVYSLLVREITGKVSHYRLAGTERAEIFSKESRFDSMESAVSFFSYQKGNGKMHGSKGVGRDIYELAGMLDRTRNEIVDRSILSGKTFVQGDIKQIHKFKVSVVGMTAIVPSGWTVLEQKIDGNIEPFLKLDAYFSMLVDQLIGTVSPPRMEGEAFRSSTAWNLVAAREEENRDAKITRFLEQFTNLVQTMQRRICDKKTDDEDAEAAREKLKEFLTDEEIDELANQPVAGTIRDLTPMERQMVAMVANEKKGNPLYNQRALEVEDLTARINADFADRVLLPQNDPTEQAEQQRTQLLEFTPLQAGQPVPVSPRDNHLIHMEMLLPVAEQTAGAIMQGAAETTALEAVLAHLTEHYNRALEQGVPKEKLKAVADVVKKSGEVLAQLKALDQEANQLQQEGQSAEAEMAGQPPMM
jgi:hypothetical protein